MISLLQIAGISAAVIIGFIALFLGAVFITELISDIVHARREALAEVTVGEWLAYTPRHATEAHDGHTETLDPVGAEIDSWNWEYELAQWPLYRELVRAGTPHKRQTEG